MIEKSDVQIITDPVSEATCPKCSHKCSVEGLPSFSSLVCAKCGHGYDVPARLGHFLLLKIIGLGGMGGVYRAHDELLKRAVAIKVMRKSLGDNETFSENFLREAQAAAKINHPNIVQIYSFGKEKGQPYIVMELVLGGGLDKLMEGGKQVDQRIVMRIAEQVADGLRHASESGMMHGDIKPENILLTENRQSKLVDFGLASVSGTASNEIWGTPFYIAPEKVRRQKADHRADIYSLGGTLYHALAGQPPFDGPDANAVVKARFVEPLRPLIELNPAIDPEISTIITRMLLVEPALRYPTYGSLLSDIRRVTERLGPEEEPAPVSKKIILKRKGRVGTTAAKQDDGGGAAATSGSGPIPSEKKIVIGRGAMAASERQSSSHISGLQAAQEGVEAAAAPVVEEDDPAARMRMVKVVILLVVLGFIGIIAAIGGLVAWRHAHVRGKERARAQAEQLRQDTIFDLRKINERAQKINEKCAADAAKGKELVTAFVGEATDFIEEEFRAYLIPPRPEPPPPPVEVDEVAEEEVKAAAAEPKAAVPDAELMAKAAAAVAAAGLPLTAENLATFAKSLNMAIAVAPAAAAAPDAPPADEAVADGAGADEEAIADEGAAPEEEAPPPLDPSQLPPVVQRIRSMFIGLYKLEETAEMAATLAQEVEAVTQAPDIGNRTLEVALELQKSLIAKCDEFAKDGPAAENGRILHGMEADRDAAIGLLKDVKERVERELREARQRAEVEAAAMAKQRAEEEQRQLVLNEQGMVSTTEAINIDLLRALEFRQATRALRTLGNTLKTEEGKAALAVAQERLKCVEEFYQFMGAVADGVSNPAAEGIDADRGLPAFTHPTHGWTIQKSDARTVTVGGKTVSWKELDDISKVMMVNFYLRTDKNVTALRFRYRIKQYINAAVFLNMFITDSPSVKQMAASLAEEAVKMFPRSREDIDRLTPGLLKAEF